MAEVHRTDAHLRLAHSLLEQFAVSDFSKRQYKILLFILRLSWGCGKKFAVIPKRSMFGQVGIGHQHIRAELAALVRDQVLWTNEDGTRFGLNKNYDEWRVSRAKGYDPAALTDLIFHNVDMYVKKPGTAEQEAHRAGNVEDIEIVTIWKSVKGMRLSEAKCYDTVTKLREDFPLVNLLKESQKWAASKIQDVLKPTSNVPRQLWNWMSFARDGFPQKKTPQLKGGTAKGVTNDED